MQLICFCASAPENCFVSRKFLVSLGLTLAEEIAE